MSISEDEFPQIQLKLIFDELPPIVITSFYFMFILLITILIYLYILIFDVILNFYKRRIYTLHNDNDNDRIPLS